MGEDDSGSGDEPSVIGDRSTPEDLDGALSEWADKLVEAFLDNLVEEF